MFCPKCGKSVPDGAGFCPVCGNAMPGADAPKQDAPMPEQPAAQTPPQTGYPQPNVPQGGYPGAAPQPQGYPGPNAPQQGYPGPYAPQPGYPGAQQQGYGYGGGYGAPPKPKKKSKKPLIIGIVAVLIVVIIVAAATGGSEIDYKASVRDYTPFQNSQNLPYTCGEVFDKYIENIAWEIDEGDSSANVTIYGTGKGTDKDIKITMRVQDSGDGKLLTYKDVKMSFDGSEASANWLLALFAAYDADIEDLSYFEAVYDELF